MCSDGLASGLELSHIVWCLRVKLGREREGGRGKTVPNSTRITSLISTALQDVIQLSFQLGVYITIILYMYLGVAEGKELLIIC